MANQFTPEQRKEVLQSFKLFDKDNDGHLTKEVASLIREMGCLQSEEEIAKLIAEVDTDGNGCIEPDEFISLMAKIMLGISSQKQIREAFSIFDIKGDSFISFDELKEVMNRMGEKMSDDDINNLIKEADEDGDGRVSYQQFHKLMTR